MLILMTRKKKTIPSVDQDVEHMKLVYISGENAERYSRLNKQFSSLL